MIILFLLLFLILSRSGERERVREREGCLQKSGGPKPRLAILQYRLAPPLLLLPRAMFKGVFVLVRLEELLDFSKAGPAALLLLDIFVAFPLLPFHMQQGGNVV